jgi:hypothetical protein
MKHLDAPWRAVADRSDVLFSHTIQSDNDRIARVLQPLNSWKHTSAELHQKENARAQLLAAAPEMLDKLRACSLFLEKERGRIDRVLEDVNELIARVEGEFAGEDFEPPPLKVNPAAIDGRLSFLDAIKKTGNDANNE